MDGELAQNAAMIAVAIVAAIIGVFKYLKGESNKEKTATTEPSAAVVAASFLDSRLIRELIDAIRSGGEEFARESRKQNRIRQELTTALEETTDAVLSNTDATVNMTRFLKKQDKGENDVS